MSKALSLFYWLALSSVCVGFDVILTDPTSIATNDISLDGTSICVDGTTLVVDGPHSFQEVCLTNGAVLTHGSSVTGLCLTVADSLIIASASRINVRGLGYRGGIGASIPTVGEGPGGGMFQWYTGGGGSHGGVGGTSSDHAPGGSTYGNANYPTTSGSGGGGTGRNGPGLPGGSTVWIKAGGCIVLEGLIDASGGDQEEGDYYGGGGGGGAGGSVLLCAPTLTGSGRIDASGGDAHAFGHFGGGGGGGRVAIYAALDGFALTNVCLTGGMYGDPAATAGTLYHYAGIPPAVVGALSLSGYVTQTVASVAVTFLTPLDRTSVAVDDFVVTGPQTCPVAGVTMPDDVTVVVELASELVADGEYVVSIGPAIASFAGGAMDADGDGRFGETPDDAVALGFTIDCTPPAPPLITNFLAAPAINIVNTALPVVVGSKDAGDTIRFESQELVPAGCTDWSSPTPIDTGMQSVLLVTRDPAGNDSDPTELRFLCDLLAPEVDEISPTNGEMVAGQPAISVTCSDASTGPDLSASFLQVAASGGPVAGAWTFPCATRAAFVPDAPLADGIYTVTIILHDQAGMVADPYISSFQIVTPPSSYAALLPAWWKTGGVVETAAGRTNDFAALNVGQLKWTAQCAAAAFQAQLPDGAGNTINDLVEGFANTQNYQAVNIGQLKRVAAPFYDRLGLTVPWADVPPTNDWVLANVGQLKHLFDMHLAEDEDEDGLPDWWETEYFGSNTLYDAAADSDGDGLTQLEEYENRSQPDAVDSDQDGVSDLLEVLHGSDPSDAASFPVDVSGALSYAGSTTGRIEVVAATTASGWEGPRCECTAVPASYLITNAVSGCPHWIKAFMDANANGVCDPWEPVGLAAGAPHALLLVTSGLDILLENPDRDADGMDDIWEMAQFGSLVPTPDSDADGDGLSNLEEFVQGTDPLVADTGSQGLPTGEDVQTGDLGLTIYTPIE